MTKYWVIVASKDHVLAGMAGGFCQACHGKKGPLLRMQPGDWEEFTALGRVAGTQVVQHQVSPGFLPYRREIAFQPVRPVSIKPILAELTFIKDPKRWGYPFRQGFFEISKLDFTLLAGKMLLAPVVQ